MLKIDFGYKLTTIRIRIILNNAMWGWFATEKFSWEQVAFRSKRNRNISIKYTNGTVQITSSQNNAF